jgi:hypothetical protein
MDNNNNENNKMNEKEKLLEWKKLKIQKDQIEKRIKELSDDLIKHIEENSISVLEASDDEVGTIKAGIKVVAPSKNVDTAKLKEAGLFDQ